MVHFDLDLNTFYRYYFGTGLRTINIPHNWIHSLACLSLSNGLSIGLGIVRTRNAIGDVLIVYSS